MLTHAGRSALVLFAVVLTAGQCLAVGPDAFAIKFQKFANEHCLECHGPDLQKSKLRLDTLPLTLDDKDIAATWVKVHDKLARGEMPPKKKQRPPEKDLNAIIAGLHGQLQDASLGKQQREGRVILRRLNRTEYETTLRDLLGPQVEVRELLPDDNSAAGFDNVSAVLDISPVHLLRYQEAAEAAIVTVVPNRPPTMIKDRRTGRQATEKYKSWNDALGKTARLQGDSLILYCRQYGHVPCQTAAVPQFGKYRVRVSAQSVGTGGKPLTMLCSCRVEYGREDTDVRSARDVPADKPTIIELEVTLKQRQVMVFSPWTLPSVREFQQATKGQPMDQYAGPALAIQWVEIEGPFDPFPSAGYERLFHDVPLKPKSFVKAEAEGHPFPPEALAKRNEGSWIYDPMVMAPVKPREDAERLIRSFLPLAFRRPVNDELVQYYVKLVHAELEKGVSFLDAMTIGYKAVFCSPHFLILTERVDETRGTKATVLDDYAIASRLSYFLWSSLPDDELFKLAAKGELSKREVLHAQVERMLNDPRAHRFTSNFAGQWLDLRNINATSPDPQIYGEFDDLLFWSMPRETELFFEEILHNDLSLTDFVNSDWTFLNQRLATHYGIPGITGGELHKVTLPPDCHRGGVLTQAAILKVTADGTRTSPVLRGKWLLDRIMGQPPSPPPPDVPSIEPDIRGATTIRQQLDKHRNTPACAACHVHIDPPGFALESFDVIGGWRNFYRATKNTRGLAPLPNYPGRQVPRGPDVELGGQTPEGRPFKDIDEYKQILLSDKDQLARSLARKLLIYSTGADIQFADREVVEDLVAKCRAKKYGFRSLVHDVVESRVFLNK
jgi:hypothetical protein